MSSQKIRISDSEYFEYKTDYLIHLIQLVRLRLILSYAKECTSEGR